MLERSFTIKKANTLSLQHIEEEYEEYLEDVDKISFDIWEFNDMVGRENTLALLGTYCI